MISAVLYEKNGVITEDRFQKLTPVQWAFHYYEIKKHKQEEAEIQFSQIKAITKAISLAGVLSHPNINLEHVISSLQSDGKNAEESAEEAMKYIEEHKEVFPDKITVKLEPKEQAVVAQGRIDRELGIIINE